MTGDLARWFHAGVVELRHVADLVTAASPPVFKCRQSPAAGARRHGRRRALARCCGGAMQNAAAGAQALFRRPLSTVLAYRSDAITPRPTAKRRFARSALAQLRWPASRARGWAAEAPMHGRVSMGAPMLPSGDMMPADGALATQAPGRATASRRPGRSAKLPASSLDISYDCARPPSFRLLFMIFRHALTHC